MSKPTVIAVIGGSFAGATLAKRLDATVDDSTTIILIEQRDAFYHCVASVRSIVDKAWARKVWIPYSGIFVRTRDRSRILKARATELHESFVILSSGEKVMFDYCVIATGTSAPSPSKPALTEKDAHLKAMDQLVDAIDAAERILIVGGGPVGIEWCGEIADKHPGKKITIVHNGPELLSSVSFATTKFKSAVLERLARFPNVEVVLNQRILAPDGCESLLPDGASWHVGDLTHTLEDGREIATDLQLLATGSRPNSEFVKKLNTKTSDEVLDAKGYIITTPTLQLVSHNHIFAIGDVAAVDKDKFSYLATEQANIAALNIASLIAGKEATHKFTAGKAAKLVVPMGRLGGVSQIYGVVAGDLITRVGKGEDLFLTKFWYDLGAGAEWQEVLAQEKHGVIDTAWSYVHRVVGVTSNFI